MSYFNIFPAVQYDVTGKGEFSQMTDFTPNFKIRDKSGFSNISYLNYVIDDGARPDVVSHYLYGTSEYYWTFFVVNDNIRLIHNDWPLSDQDMDNLISYRYDNYSVMSFNPTTIPNGSLGNLSCVPFKKKYDGMLKIIPVDSNSNEIDSYSIVSAYDYSSCQLSINRIISGSVNTVNFIDGYDRYKIKPIIPAPEDPKYDELIALVNEYRTDIATAYGLPEGTSVTDDYMYEIAKDQSGNKLNWEYMRNAAYQYFTIDAITEDALTFNGYDILTNSSNFNTVRFISYYEKETIKNNQKKTISVIHPNNIVQFVKSYTDAVRNV